jgi:hypothetical protein
LVSLAIHLISTDVPNAAIGPYSFTHTLIVPPTLALTVPAVRSLRPFVTRYASRWAVRMSR